jgi:hypothetical protein
MTCRLALLALVLGLLASCRGDDQAPAARGPQHAQPERPDQLIGGNVIPQSHEVPTGRAADVRRLFDSGAMSYPIAVVSEAGTQTQFVNPKPVFVGDKRFVVGAPPHVHAAIDQTLKSLGQPHAGTSATFEVTYWVIEAAAGAEEKLPSDLAELAPLLEKLDGLGPRRFKLVDRIGGRARDGAASSIHGRIAEVSQKLTPDPDRIELEVELKLHGVWSDVKDRVPSLDTTLQLQVDKPIVLGDSSLAAAADGVSNLLLYVVRARRVD